MQHHADRAERRARVERVLERRQRLLADLLVLGGAVEQVDRVDEHRVDPLGGVDRLAVGGDLLVGVDAGPPRARALVEELDRAAGTFLTPGDRVGRPACGRYMTTDQHGFWTLFFRGMLCPEMRFDSLRLRPAPSTSGERGRHCTTGCWPGATAPSSSCGSRHRPRGARPRERGADLRGAALARPRLGRRPRLPVPAAGPPHRGRRAADRGRPRTAPPPAPTRSRPTRRRTATPASAAATTGRAPSGCGCPTRAPRSCAT